jgi:hypothetical protein
MSPRSERVAVVGGKQRLQHVKVGVTTAPQQKAAITSCMHNAVGTPSMRLLLLQQLKCRTPTFPYLVCGGPCAHPLKNSRLGIVPSSTKAPITIMATGPVLQAPAATCSFRGSLLHMSSLAPPAMSSKLPISTDVAKAAHMHRFLVVPQPQYTIFSAAGFKYCVAALSAE